ADHSGQRHRPVLRGGRSRRRPGGGVLELARDHPRHVGPAGRGVGRAVSLHVLRHPRPRALAGGGRGGERRGLGRR
ncbi:MAG: Beta-ketoadipate enol-lactone hydrolase, partial [uncultured Microvirga sp.]